MMVAIPTSSAFNFTGESEASYLPCTPVLHAHAFLYRRQCSPPSYQLPKPFRLSMRTPEVLFHSVFFKWMSYTELSLNYRSSASDRASRLTRKAMNGADNQTDKSQQRGTPMTRVIVFDQCKQADGLILKTF